MLDLLLALGIFGAAMFAEPAVPELMKWLVWSIGAGVGYQVSGSRCRVSAPDTWHMTPDTRFLAPDIRNLFPYRRRASGVSVRRTGTEVRRALRTICT